MEELERAGRDLQEEMHWFCAVNSSKGYVSWLEEEFEGLRRTCRLQDYPPFAARELFQSVLETAREKGLSVGIVHNALSNDIQGVLLPQIGAGVYTSDPWYGDAAGGLSLLDDELLQTVRSHLKGSWEALGRARFLREEWKRLYTEYLEYVSADRLAEDLQEEILGGRSLEKPGRAKHRFFGAFTARGRADYLRSLTDGLSKRYFLKGRPGCGKSTILRKISQAALRKGFCAELYQCPLSPDTLDMLVLRELGVCLFDSTAPHEYFPVRDSDTVVDVYRETAGPELEESALLQMGSLAEKYKEEIRKAGDRLHLAGMASEAFWEYHLYPLDEDELDHRKLLVLEKLFL